MKDKILQALKTNYSKFGFSEKTLDGVANYLTTSVTEEADINNAVAGVESMLKSFQSVYDTLRGEKSSAEKQLSELKTQIETLGNGGKEQPKPQASDNTPEWAKALLEQNKALTDRLNKMDSEKLSVARKSEINNLIKDLPKSVQSAYNRLTLDTMNDEEYSQFKAEIKNEAEAISKDLSQKGAIFGAPKTTNVSQSAKQATNEEVEAVLNNLKI